LLIDKVESETTF